MGLCQEQINALNSANVVLRDVTKTFQHGRKVIADLLKKNFDAQAELRRLEDLESAKGVPKLDFDEHGEVLKKSGGPRLMVDGISLADEKILLQPLEQSLADLQGAFIGFSRTKVSNLSESTRTKIIRDAVSCLLEIAQCFRIHRLFYLCLSASQSAWTLVKSEPKIAEQYVLECGAAYIEALRTLQMYKQSVIIFMEVKELTRGSGYQNLLQFGLWVVESVWTLLLSSQRLVSCDVHKCDPSESSTCDLPCCPRVQLETAFSVLAELSTRVKNSELANAEESYLHSFIRAHMFRLIAHLFLIESERVFTILKIPRTTSPLFLLENAKDLITASLETWGGNGRFQYCARGLYMTLLQDLTIFMLRIGAPMEALPFSNSGLAFAKRELSSRWTIVFLTLVAQCRLNQGQLSEFNTTAQDLRRILSNRSPSILKPLLKSHPPVQKSSAAATIDCITTATDDLNLNRIHGEGDEARDPSTAYCSQSMVKLTCLTHKESCDCLDCVDFDLHVSFLENILLTMRSNVESSQKVTVMKQCKDYYGVLKFKGDTVIELVRKGGRVVSTEESDDILPNLVAPVMIRIWLRNIGNGFQYYKPNVHEKQPEGLFKILSRVKTYSELRVMQPDILAQARLLDAINLMIIDTTTREKAMKFIKSRWSMSTVNGSHPGQLKRGDVIEDRLTGMFAPATPSRERERSSTATLRQVSPVSNGGGKPRREKPAEFNAKPGEKKQKCYKVSGLGEQDAPEMPAELQDEAVNQTRLADSLSSTTTRSALELAEDDVRYLAETSFVVTSASKSSELSDGIKQAISVLQLSLADMASFPLYPYQRMAANLLMLLIGDKDSETELSGLVSKSLSGRFNHLSLMYYNRLLQNSDESLSKEIKQRMKHFAPGTDPSWELKTKLLPPGWVVCSICCSTQLTLPIRSPVKTRIQNIVITRWEHGYDPISFQLAVDDQLQGKIMEEHAEILAKADQNQKSHSDAKDYWATRLRLDYEMKDNIQSMESLLGYVRALLMTKLTEYDEMMSFARYVKVVEKRFGTVIPDNIRQILIMAVAAQLSTEHFISLTATLLKKPEHSPLVVSLVTALSKFTISPTSERYPLILMLDSDMWSLPWESIPSLIHQPVTRVPSVQFLNMQLFDYQRQQKLKHEKVYYIVNPGMDLRKGEEHFQAFLRRFKLENIWRGVSGVRPSRDELKSAWEDELIVYSGHGSGQQYFQASALDCKSTQASMFLMGCSSARLESSITMDGTAFLHNCLMMGSPCVVGNLWVVLSNWIDMFTEDLLEKMLQSRKRGNRDGKNCFAALFRECQDSNAKVTKLKQNFLIGTAPVVIGLPWSY